MAEAQQPPGESENPYLPPGPEPLEFSNFLGIDTSAPRSGIPDEAMAWCDGFYPLAPGNARTLPGVGTPIYTAGTPGTVMFYDFANLGTAPICVVFLANGSIVQVNTLTLATTTIAPAGTITASPILGNVGISQWGSKFILIVAKQTNGYFIWDGTNLFKSGTLGPLVTVTDGGQGYTSAPTVTASGGSGTGATFLATLQGDLVLDVVTVNPGSGYLAGDEVILTFSGGGSDNVAVATGNITAGGGIQAIAVITGGGQYSSLAQLVITGVGTNATAVLQAANGTITGVVVTLPGMNYAAGTTVAIVEPAGGHGVGFNGEVTIATGQITSVTVTNGGSGYTTAPKVTVVGDGVGASFLAHISGGAVTSVDVISPGYGYTKALIVFVGGNLAAAATVTTMPFGISGSAVETYQSRPWISNNNILNYAAPESLQDFSTSGGGGFIESTDSFLRVSYTKPVQTNGFLYLIADSSINYISGVQTSGTPPTTTFTNQNADPEVGTPWPNAIDTFSRNIIFANPFGVHVSYGGAVTKVSEALDGVYTSVANFGGLVPSSAKALIFGRKVWMCLIPIIDPISGAQVNKLFLWNGKTWFSSSQDVPLTFIRSQEVNSILTAYGTNGTRIYPLFQQPSTAFTKTIQSKLWSKPGGYEFTKSVGRLWGMSFYRSTSGQNLTVGIDSEATQSTVTITGPGTLGNFVWPPTAVGQQGAITGITISTNAADMTLVSAMMKDEIQVYRG